MAGDQWQAKGDAPGNDQIAFRKVNPDRSVRMVPR
jgi:hypothetical protein